MPALSESKSFQLQSSLQQELTLHGAVEDLWNEWELQMLLLLAHR